MGIMSKATARMHGVVDEVADAAAPAAQWLDEQGETVTSTYKYLAAHPLQSLGLALAAGYLIGRFTR